MYDILQLNDMLVPELKEIAQRLGIKGYHRLTKKDLIYKILDQQAFANKNSEGSVPSVEEPAPGRKIVVKGEKKEAKKEAKKDGEEAPAKPAPAPTAH